MDKLYFYIFIATLGLANAMSCKAMDMKIMFRQKEIADINSVDELEKFIIEKKAVNNFKSFRWEDQDNILSLINSIDKINYKHFKAHGFIKKFINVKSHWNIDYWIARGYSKQEAEDNINSLQVSNSIKMLKDKEQNPEKYKGVYNTQIEYWIDKCDGDVERAERLLNERQTTFSLDICISKYGEVEGRNIWKERQEKWISTLSDKPQEEIDRINSLKIHTKETMIERYGEEEGLKRYEAYVTKHNNLFDASKWSLEIIDEVIHHLSKYGFTKDDFYYGSNGSKEYFLRDKDNSIFFYDLTIPKLNTIIEFNGEHIHPNKELLSENEWNSWRQAWTNKTADECWEYDLKKKELAEQNGFKILYIWYNEGIESGTNKCLELIKKHING